MARNNSFWSRTFHEARSQGGWMLVRRYYSRSTAAQLASDISRAHHRSLDSVRVQGILAGEQWEARWEHADHAPNGDFVVWIRLARPAD